ncbi:phage tail assembly chaperone [Sandaracinobacteroides saxicola]|uniref:Phage tail assembly chaperone n=1 Tax=Sandaracinobacteroides saxicola TaxID=2759707 RepID=A0A7G5IJ47_9SPHN|nr:phage tail assembly chaperone [Sandaracinobacteroides saxicola]QMW23389.1 phage tail assembly chaperone [Sandaracinobacteroides saxicola]
MLDFAGRALWAARVATGVLGWSPADFWAATPAELRLAVEGRAGRFGDEGALDSVALARLQEMLPDG